MVTKVVIVGGGTGGWMAAAYLRKALKDVEITVVESASIGRIGVGEATFSSLKLFFDFLGLDEAEWMPACNGTYKMGIRFQNWTAAKGHFYHPFQRYPMSQGFNAAEWWLKLKRQELPFDRACFTVPELCDANLSPRFLDGTVFDDAVTDYFTPGKPPPNNVIAHHQVQYPYGYHFDAALVAGFLMSYALKLGVKRVVDEVLEVKQTPQGFISHVVTRDHGNVSGELFLDCTGFRGLLINKTLGEPFTHFNDSLPNDSAVAIQVPSDSARDGLRPYTTATALDAGWAWTIPLFHRNGSGYVYCSQFLTPQQAEEEFRRFLGPAADGQPANHIQMRVGRNRNSWVKNCVAIGLSSGFVEPLESTGIFFIQHGIEELVNHWPSGPSQPEGQLLSYNKVIGECIDGVREFLTLHYAATDRSDTPYWRHLRQLRLPPALEERLRIFRSRLPGSRNIYQPFHGFEAYSWSTMALGLNHVPPRHLPGLDQLDDAQALAMFEQVQQRKQQLLRTLPTQYEYLVHQRRQVELGLRTRSVAV